MSGARRASGTTLAILQAVERLLLMLAIVSLGWYVAVQITSALSQASWADELERLAASRAQAATTSRAPVAPVARERPARMAGSLVGRIDLPRLGVSAIAREGVEAGTLRRAVGHIPFTSLPGARGNAAFAGHRDTFFRGLKDVRNGDRITVTTPEGLFSYIVRESRIVSPADVSVLDPTHQPTLTLVTCYPFSYIGAAPKRFIVRATLVDDSAN
jgi:sortase A